MNQKFEELIKERDALVKDYESRLGDMSRDVAEGLQRLVKEHFDDFEWELMEFGPNGVNLIAQIGVTTDIGVTTNIDNNSISWQNDVLHLKVLDSENLPKNVYVPETAEEAYKGMKKWVNLVLENKSKVLPRRLQRQEKQADTTE